nr:nucleoside-diphosphate sugar epimerase/dehydratase [Aequorivita echinoideorum]
MKLLDQRYLPRWAVLSIDICICIFSFLAVYFIIVGTPLQFYNVLSTPYRALAVIGINVLFFYIFRTYAGIIRHSTFTDVFRVASASFGTAVALLLINFATFLFFGQKVFLTTGILLYAFISFTILLFFRISVKESYQFLKNFASGNLKKRVLIVGVQDNTISLGKALTTDGNMPFTLAGFITENPHSKRIKILGKPVFSVPVSSNSNSFTALLADYSIDGVLVISDSLTIKEKNQIVEACLANKIEIFNVPTMEHWNKREDISTHIKRIQIEDLLERQPIAIDSDLIKQDLEGKAIMVTGGAGSIGSEIVRQVSNFNPKIVVIVDNAESALHTIELEMKDKFPDLKFSTQLSDITNEGRMERIYNKYNFDVVYHAAAYKHVPLIERNPREAIRVNINGTRILAELAVKYNVGRFVMISTDKAVNPTNVMGASKRAAEMYVQSLQNSTNVCTRFITTRFGNVLGSNGSVIPYFRKQIEEGGPVTVTHKDIIRYFMTISEACQLVLQAGTMGKGGEIFVFDMGKPIRILDMAERMIALSGLKPYEDIDIKITGLREGEKLYEELLNDGETTLPTYHPKITVSKVVICNFKETHDAIENLILLTKTERKKTLVKALKTLVPEYVSNNSVFEELDKKPSLNN